MRWLLILGVVCVGFTLFADGEGDKTDEYLTEGAKVDKKRVKEAVKRAVEWLKSQQKEDGHWEGTGTYMEMYPFGTTALAVYALLKGGVPPNDPCIQKALKWLKKGGFPGTYSVSCLVLALAALCEPPPPEKEVEKVKVKQLKRLRTRVFEPVEKRIRKRFRRAPRWIQDWLRQAVNWLIKAKTRTVWRYPGKDPGEIRCKKGTGIGGGEDASNAQYAMLAMFAALRLGIPVPKQLFIDVAEYYIKQQDKDGAEVKGFPVPGADLPLKRLKKMIEEQLKRLKEEARKTIDASEEGRKELIRRLKTSAVLKENPYKKFGGEVKKMKARGWCYLPREFPKGGNVPDDMFRTTGSMTTSGIIALCVCKLALEGTPWYKVNGKRLEQAIRDGVAWLAHNWTLDKNPNSGPGDAWRYYYFYGVERVGALALVRKIGKHLWYEEIANRILSEQQSDGSWAGERGQSPKANVLPFEHGPLWNTCFAILILKRATPPIVGGKDTDLAVTGKGIFGPRKEPKKERR